MKFQAHRASMANSAATAAMTAEALFPGNVGARMGCQMVGGLVNLDLRPGRRGARHRLRQDRAQNLSPRDGDRSGSDAGRCCSQDRRDMDAVHCALCHGRPGAENLTPGAENRLMAGAPMGTTSSSRAGSIGNPRTAQGRVWTFCGPTSTC